MTDVSQQSVLANHETGRGTAILIYVLLLIGWPTAHLSTIVAIVLAYVQRGEFRGTIWESHFDNIINVFWTTLVLGLVCFALCFLVVGIPLMFALAIWFLFRTIKGLVRAIDNKGYF